MFLRQFRKPIFSITRIITRNKLIIPPKGDKKVEKIEKKDSEVGFLDRSDPFNSQDIMYPKLFLFTLLGASVVLSYLYIMRDREFKRLDKQFTDVQSYGKPLIGGPFKLVDHDGIPRTDADFKGSFLMIYFGFTHCPDICPMELDKVGKIIKALGKMMRYIKIDLDPEVKDCIRPVFISVDPIRDGVEQVKDYLAGKSPMHFCLDFHPKFVGLTGPIEEIEKCARKYRVLKGPDANDYLMDHSAYVYLMDPKGEFIDVFGSESTLLQMVSRLTNIIKDYDTHIEKVQRIDLQLPKIPAPVEKAQEAEESK
ncbi:SCO1-SenC-domain-containing protein [Rozella allomycis CSF55]|uniref:SCO1-SenC-domain-containing protein n=1 Tax=Rozella allomycis (strain CSF55) TaxID=988480 RepID=A0A075ASZ1_ROZAC|nr:Thioredoxin-like fold domain-containing protein [Rozella allomycis CSF55]RKP20977.1 SCO1-SenC-domain-containing protein [Rozella allomycis CSF55]|eukprot:EPZ31603.1 Thioredoxin-like fold domain-containing protein [Rozella allomycis CSF55]